MAAAAAAPVARWAGANLGPRKPAAAAAVASRGDSGSRRPGQVETPSGYRRPRAAKREAADRHASYRRCVGNDGASPSEAPGKSWTWRRPEEGDGSVGRAMWGEGRGRSGRVQEGDRRKVMTLNGGFICEYNTGGT